MGGFIIGIDLGGTKIAGALANSNGKIIKDTFLPTPKTSAINIYHTILKVIKELKIYCKHKKIYGIGFAVPGQIDLEKGIVINAPNLKSWNGFSLVTQLKRDLNLPIIIDNDANAAALAECLFGSGRKFNDFVYITVSTGIGSGIIINKKIFYGSHQTSGEIGHTIIDIQQELYSRKMGTLEYLASGTGIARIAAQNLKPSSIIYKQVQGKKAKISGKIIFQAAKKGDKYAKKLVAANGKYLAAGIVNLVNIVDPEAVIIGGGLSHSGKIFFNSIKQGLKYFQLMTPSKKINILPAKLKTHSGLYGAIALVMQKIKK